MSVNIDSAAANLTAADVAADQMQRSPIAAGVEEAEAEAAQTRLGADGSSSASEASESDDEHAAAAASIELPAVEEDEPEEPAPPTEPSAAEPEKPRVLPPPRELFEVDTPDPLLQPPKTGNGNPMLYPPPRHVTAEPAEPQPLQPNASLHMLAAQLMAADAERLQNPALSLNRVVYDSNEPLDMATNPFVTAESLHSVHPPLSKRKEAAAAAAAAAANNNGGAAGEPSAAAALRFESRFESGNLRRAVQVSEYEYDLILRPDANTRGHTQWFYFGVAKMKHGPLYKFNVVNCVKPDSLFNAGMLPLVYSTKEVARTGLGWRRMGHNVCYYQNHIKRRTGYYYTASFQVTGRQPATSHHLHLHLPPPPPPPPPLPRSRSASSTPTTSATSPTATRTRCPTWARTSRGSRTTRRRASASAAARSARRSPGTRWSCSRSRRSPPSLTRSPRARASSCRRASTPARPTRHT